MRKRLVLLFSVVILLAVIGYIGSIILPVQVGKGKEKTITVWCWDPAFNIFAMEEAAKIYGEKEPNVKISIVETPWDDIQTKLTTAVVSGQTATLPDILLMQDNALAKNVMNYPESFVDLTNSGIDFSK